MLNKKYSLMQLLAKSLFFVLLLLVGCFQSTDKSHYSMDAVSTSTSTHPVIVLGSGVAGLTAANYLAQANIPVVVIEGNKPGGALIQSHSVRNWPGIIDQPGAEIIASLRQQAEQSGVKILSGNATAVDFKQWPFTIKVYAPADDATISLSALSCIIATGAEPNYLGIPGEQGDNGYWGRGVTNCAVCDGALYKNATVAIVGGGDAAITEASYLAGIAKEVMIFVRGKEFRAKDVKKRDEVLKLSHVKTFFNTKITEICGNESSVTHIKTKNTLEQKEADIIIDGLFLAIGSHPNTDLFSKQLACDNYGHLVLIEDQETSIKGVFAAGDVCDPKFRQAVTSAGQGCKAALQAQKFLDDLGYKPNIKK